MTNAKASGKEANIQIAVQSRQMFFFSTLYLCIAVNVITQQSSFFRAFINNLQGGLHSYHNNIIHCRCI
jgi:hypothetical protein